MQTGGQAASRHGHNGAESRSTRNKRAERWLRRLERAYHDLERGRVTAERLNEIAPILVDSRVEEVLTERLTALPAAVVSEYPGLAFAAGSLRLRCGDGAGALGYFVSAAASVTAAEPALAARVALEIVAIQLGRGEGLAAEAVLAWAEGFERSTERLADVSHLRALMADYVGDFRRARECYLEATRYSESTLTPLTTVLAQVNLAVALHNYVPRDALALARLSLQMADEMCATRSVTPPILNVLGYAFICNGEFDSAVTSLESARADAIRLHHPRTALYARFNTSILRELKGDLTGADDLLAYVGASAPGSTSPSLAPWTTIRRAWLELLRGDAAKADRAPAALERITGECYSDAIATLEALFAIQRGELGNARAELERQIGRALARDDRLTAFVLLMWLVHLESEGGRMRAAEFAAERAHSLGQAGGFVLSPNWWDGRIVRSAMAVSNDARAVYFSGLFVPPERQRAQRVAQIDDAGEIYLDGIPLSTAVWREGHSGSRLLRRLVAALARAGEAGLTREEICDLVWPESEGDRAVRNFYAACNDLRRLLCLVPATRLVLRSGRYRLVCSGPSDDDRTRSMRAAATQNT